MLRMRMLGDYEVELDGTPLAPPESRRAWSLLAWLALHPTPHHRAKLAARFWPDTLDANARANLRSAIWSLRRTLGATGERYLAANRDSVGLIAEHVWTDVGEVARLADAGDLEDAVALCRGDLLPDLDDDWVYEARDEHRDRLGRVLGGLAERAERTGDAEAAVRYTRSQAALLPLSEDVHRDLIRRLAASGDRAGALVTAERLRERFHGELGIELSQQTRRLVRSIRAPGEQRRRPAPPGQPPLAGRADAMARLLTAWESACRGGGRVIDIRGEAGIGKTRLTLELAERATADGGCVALAAAMDLIGAAPFGLWAELLRDIVRDLTPPTLDSSWAALLSRLVPELGDDAPERAAAASPELDRARLFGGITRLVEYAAAERPLLLVMEDVHLADLPSLHLVDYLGRRLAALPVLIVLTRRDVPRRAEVETLELRLRSRGVFADGIQLGPLPDADLTALVRSVAPIPDGEARRIAAAAEGNPLLAVESARAANSGEPGLAAGIRGSVRAALGGLGADAMLVAEVAAVAGRPLERSELAALPVERVPDAVTEALDSGLVVADPARVGYRHALLREAAYADLPVPRRLWLHETFAGILQADEARGGRCRAAEVARHLRLAGCDEIAVAHLARAAADARAVSALTEAAGYLTEAVGIAPDDAALWLDLAEVHAWLGDRAESDRCFDQVLGKGAQAWLRRGRWMRGAMCYPRAALEAYRQVLRFPGISARERAEALAGSAWAEAVAGDAGSVGSVGTLIEEVETLVEADSRPDLLVHDLGSARTFALIRQGEFERCYQPAAEAAAAARRAGRPDMAYACWHNASSAAACAGDFGRALDFADRGRAEVHGVLPTREVELIAARAHILARMGRAAEARAAAEEELALADQLDRPDLSATARHDRGMVAFAAGDFSTAARCLGEALDADAPVSRARVRLTRAEALVRLGQLDDAERELRTTVLEPLTPSDFPATLVPRLTRVQGLVAAARGDHALAERRLTEAADGWRRCSGGGLGDDYVATLTDLGRPPVEGLVEPARERDQVLLELDALRAGASVT